jgi:hypothetical protein
MPLGLRVGGRFGVVPAGPYAPGRMCWFNWLGVGLQVVGLLGAMYLLARLRERVVSRGVVEVGR